MKNSRIKGTILVVIVMLISTGILMFISYQKASQAMAEQLELSYSVTADRYAQELTAWVNKNATIIDTMATEISVEHTYEQDYDRFQSFLSDHFLRLNREGDIYDIYFTYPDNRMVCASGFLADGSVDYAHDREWFTRAAATGDLFYSTPYKDSDTKKSIVTISRGVYKDNTLQGVLAADIFVDVLENIIAEADVAENSYAFLVDQNLCMIVHPNAAYAFDDVPRKVMDVPDAPYGEVISKIRSDSSETVYLTDYDGVERGVVVSKMENTGWFIGVATSTAVLRSSMNSLLRWYLAAALVAAAVGGVIAVFLSYLLSKIRTLRSEKSGEEAPAKETVKNDAKLYDSLSGKYISGGISLMAPILTILFLMIIMVIYTSRIINDVAVTNIREVGEDRIGAAAAQLENYLEMERSALWVTADTVDHMTKNGATPQDISNYIIVETDNQKVHFDANITGLYGYVMGEYLDGLSWQPPENYDPTRRDWYLTALAANGETTIVSPYVDAQTGSVIISICRMLSNGKDVLSVDLMMDQIQEIVSDLKIKGKGYGFIINEDGMIIAHQDEAVKGHYLTEDETQIPLLDGVLATKNGIFEITSGNEQKTVFVRQIVEQWYVVIVINSRELLAEVNQQLGVNVLICTVIFALITLFYILGRKNEQRYSKRIEEMRIEEQKQAYEAKALLLEKEAADRANQAKSAFLADMSHEIRTPINAVLGMNEMILRESLQAEGRNRDNSETFRNISAYARDIESAGSNLLAIINDILDFSRIEAGKMDLVEGKYHLSSVLNDLSNMTWFKTREKGLDFRIHVDESLPDELLGDEVRVRQIITNLLNNAVKYTEYGSVKLDLSGRIDGEAEAGKAIQLIASVEDTGIGIREEDLDRLFNKFERLDLKQNSTVEGTGLGLAITRSLLDMMGGTIEVKSEYGKGSVFTAIIPQKILSPLPIGDFHSRFRTNVQEAAPYRENFRAPQARILIVDDTKMNLTVAVGLLKNTMIQIDTAVSGKEALDLTQINPYDLILMDQRMPNMDGTEALHIIRTQEDGANRETPVICLTADAVIGSRERYLAEGFTDYLTKPIDSQALEEILIRYLPEDKVILISEEAETEPLKEDPARPYASLAQAGIDPAEGMKYCLNDAALYRSLLEEYAAASDEKSRLITAYYEEKDWKNYSIHVHAVKSSSRTIGAAGLSKIAADLEAAADRNEEAVIVSKHGTMLEEYRQVVQAIRALFAGEGSSLPDDAMPKEEEEILEFLPDDR